MTTLNNPDEVYQFNTQKPIADLHDKELKQKDFREIILGAKQEDAEQDLRLKLKDEDFDWNNLYLGRSKTFEKDKSPKKHNVVVPIIPRSYATPDRDPAKAVEVPEGWLYIIRQFESPQGTVVELWRELKSDGLGNFSDVNVKKFKGKEQRKATGQPGFRIIVPYCIDVPGFQEGVGQARPARERRRAEWGLAPGELALLFAGKLIPCKRPGDLVAVVQRLRAEGVPAQAVFVGAGPLEGQLRDQAQATGSPAYFAGFKNQSEMPACYGAADLLVLPSDSETWGLAVNEAFACGLPAVVSSAVGCAPDLIEEGLTGAVYTPGDLAGLHGAIRRMAGSKDHPDTQNALVNKTRAYTPEASATALVEAIWDLLSMRNGEKRPQRGTA